MKRIVFVIVLAALLIATTGAASAGTTRIPFEGKTACDGKTLTVVREWMAGHIYQGRGFIGLCYDKADIPQMRGVETIEFNIDGGLILVGKDRMVTKEGGVWEGSWQLPAGTSIIHIGMQGQGIYEGMQLHMWENEEDNSFWGYIEVTGSY